MKRHPSWQQVQAPSGTGERPCGGVTPEPCKHPVLPCMYVWPSPLRSGAVERCQRLSCILPRSDELERRSLRNPKKGFQTTPMQHTPGRPKAAFDSGWKEAAWADTSFIDPPAPFPENKPLSIIQNAHHCEQRSCLDPGVDPQRSRTKRARESGQKARESRKIQEFLICLACRLLLF